MLIRVRGGGAGIREKLLTGMRPGRPFLRNVLDKRVVLVGDLELTDLIVGGMVKHGERVLHVKLIFCEDWLDRDVLLSVTREFVQFAMVAYAPGEYNVYAEAHLPKVKSYLHHETGQRIERKPHVHIFIPEQNLLSGHHLNPFGKVSLQAKYLAAFQTFINRKYNLADIREDWMNNNPSVVTRNAYHGACHFRGQNAHLKEDVLVALLAEDVRTVDDFSALLSRFGVVSLRREAGGAPYFNFRVRGAAKGVNLKEFVFRQEFIELPVLEKQRHVMRLATTPPDSQHMSNAESRDSCLLHHWMESRAMEVKYINSGNRSLFERYRSADKVTQRGLLAQLAARFYAKYEERMKSNLPASPYNLPQDIFSDRRPVAATHSTTPEDSGSFDDDVIGQMLRDLSEQRDKNSLSGLPEAVRSLDPLVLLNDLARSHGLVIEKYAVERRDDGARIMVGGRAMGVFEFLLDELHFPVLQVVEVLSSLANRYKQGFF